MDTNGAEPRFELNTMGSVQIPGGVYWGTQTQRAVQNFSISDARIPIPIIRATTLYYGLHKGWKGTD